MESARTINLLNLFEFYLAAMFVLSAWRRVEFYRAVVGLAFSLANKYPRLFALIRQHRRLFQSWPVIGPAVLAMILWLAHSILLRFVLPSARLSLAGLFEHWYGWLIVLPLGIAMIALDAWYLTQVGVIDRREVEKYFEQAEYWLRGWQAPAVRVITFGYVDPKKIVREEVRKALESLRGIASTSLLWTTLQIGARLIFGANLWVAWAVFGVHD